jgi:hypothetical protein
MIVRRVGVWSIARMYGALLGAVGLFAGVVVALFSLVGMGLAGSSDAPSMLGPILGVGAIVLLPLCYGLMGIVAGAVMAGLYNLFARMVGGVELDIA